MSTRCHVAIYESESAAKADNHHALLYKHSDGYPDGVLPILEPFLKQFKEVRGMGDTEYLSAWTLHALMEDSVKHSIETRKWLIENKMSVDTMPENGMQGVGFSICSGLHGDIEYLYKIYPDVLEVFERHGSWENPVFKPIQRIEIA